MKLYKALRSRPINMLMNCKNVELETAGKVHLPRTKGQKRRGERQPVEYKTIVLPGTNNTSRGNGENSRLDIAQHQVRGHFKTFTDDRPLMGKHTGTYWWGWQVRGDAKNGVNINDYKIAERP